MKSVKPYTEAIIKNPVDIVDRISKYQNSVYANPNS